MQVASKALRRGAGKPRRTAIASRFRGQPVPFSTVEPIAQDNPLLASPNTLLTPHIAWATRTARQNITRIIAENIAGWMAGQPKSVVNKAYLNG